MQAIFTSKKAILLLVVGVMAAQLGLIAFLSRSDIPVAQAADCNLTVTGNAQKTNSTASYIFEINNNSTNNCSNVNFTVYYSDQETAVSSSPKATAGNYYWRIISIAGNQKLTFQTTTNFLGSDLHTEACAAPDSGGDSCIFITQFSGNQAPVPPVPTPPTTPPVTGQNVISHEYGLWVWTSPIEMTDAYRSDLIDFASKQSFNVLYVTIDDYLAINALPNGKNKTQKIANYESSVEKLLILAKQKNIQIDAEAGWRDWTDASKRGNTNNIIKFVSTFNNSHNVKFRGVQFDVEPYLLPTYEKNKASVLATYVDWVQYTSGMANNYGVTLSLVIPHFYDSTQKWTPQITFNNKTDFTFNHLLSILGNNPNSSIIIMAYRNFASGNNGAIQISEKEIQDASGGSTVKIVIALETGDVDPGFVTFYGQSKSSMQNIMDELQNYFKKYVNFNGLAVHYYEPFSELR